MEFLQFAMAAISVKEGAVVERTNPRNAVLRH